VAADASLVLDALDAQGRGLRVRFIRTRDRLRHEVALVSPGGERMLLRSIEGDDQDRWPESPPFQQATRHEVEAGRPAALLVGMAGRSHWSASVEADAAQRRLIFDVACRLSEPAGRLGSAYEAAAAIERRGEQIVFSSSQGLPRCQIVLQVESGAKVRWDSPERFAIDAAALSAGIGTVRWRYALKWSPFRETSARNGR
jgi:hypothetical protein